jgi:putative tryptophan/tyrosine transport system substrate-binding protein
MRRRKFIVLFGSTSIWPLVRSEPSRVPVVAFLRPGSPERSAHLVAAFCEGLRETGYEDGRNATIQYEWAEDQYDRLLALADDLVRRRVAVIVATGANAVLAVSRITTTIPIVFNFASDPVKLGLVASLSRPGKNITGISSVSIELAPKQLELLHQCLPAVYTMALLVNPANSIVSEVLSKELRVTAHALGLQLHVLSASNEREVHEVFASLPQLGAGGLVIGPDTFLDGRSKELGMLSVRYGVPAIYQFREFIDAGGLMSYGTTHTDPYRQAGTYAGKILDGANPRDLPVQQSSKIELAINLRTAKSLNLDVPLCLLARADKVVE